MGLGREGISTRIEILYKLAECFTLYKAQRQVAGGYHIDIEDLQGIRVKSMRSTQIIIVNDLEEASFVRISSTSHHSFLNGSLSLVSLLSSRRKLRNLMAIFQVCLDTVSPSINCILFRAILAPPFKLVRCLIVIFSVDIRMWHMLIYPTRSWSWLRINWVVRRGKRRGARRRGVKCTKRVQLRRKIVQLVREKARGLRGGGFRRKVKGAIKRR
jgi:hypothetical protein